MSPSPPRSSDAGRLQAWVVVLVIAFVAVALQQSHRYHRMGGGKKVEAPADVRTAYRNALHAFDFYCDQETANDPTCEAGQAFLQAISRRRCRRARVEFGVLLAAGPDPRPSGHPLGPPFQSVLDLVCENRDAPSERG